MRAIVTGGCGFIGSHLVDLLVSKSIEVTVLDDLSSGRIENISQNKDKVNFIKTNMQSKEELDKIIGDGDLIFHMAGLADVVPSIEMPTKYFLANVYSTQFLLESCREKKIKSFIYAASSSCYGIPENFPTKESEICKPLYPYALTKYLGEQLCMHWAEVYKLPLNSMRLFNVYGPRARTAGTYGAAFGVFIGQMLNNLPLTIVGDGTQTRDFIYVGDVVEAFYELSQSTIKNQIFNLCTGNPISINKIASLISNNTINIAKRPGEPDITHGDPSKLNSLLGWKAKINIEKGVDLLLKDLSWAKDAPAWTEDKIKAATNTWFKYLS